MPTIDELTSTFLVTPDANGFPRQFDNSLITPIVDCDAYNAEIVAALATVGTGTASENAANQQFILIHNWWLGLEATTYLSGNGLGDIDVQNDGKYTLDGPFRLESQSSATTVGGTNPLLELLKSKAQKGVDVRVMGWITSGITQGSKNARAAVSFAQMNAGTLRSLQLLRPALGFKAITNEIAHTAGASHLKMVIVGSKTSAVGFTGGLDFEMGRWGQPFHEDYFVPDPGNPDKEFFELWHDVVAKVTGPAVVGLYEWYSTIWKEVTGRPPVTYMLIDKTSNPGLRFPIQSHSLDRSAAGSPDVAPFPLPLPVATSGGHRVQSLRTSPLANFDLSNRVVSGLVTSQAPSYAPQGLQEFQAGIQKAISGASKYIYLEDQNLWSRDIMGYIHDRLLVAPDLKVILVTGGKDPNDAEDPLGYLAASMSAVLNGIGGGSALPPSAAARVRLYLRLTEYYQGSGTIVSVNAVPPGTYELTLGDVPQGLVDRIAEKKSIAANQLAGAPGGALRAQVRVGSNVFPVVSNPQLTPGGQVKFTVQPGAYDIFTLDVPATGAFNFYLMPGITIHSKTTLIDDQCAIIGSANAMRRSLFTDIEHSVVFVDTGASVMNYRTALWSDHFRHTPASDFNDIDAGLHAWNSLWGTAGAAPLRPPNIIQIPLPITASLTSDQNLIYDALKDVDSRQSWGGITRLNRIQAIFGVP